MKKFAFALAILLMAPGLSAQRTLEKQLDHQGQPIRVDLKFASDIRINTWDRPTVHVRAEINTRDGKFLDLYALDIEQNEKSITITSKADKLFDALHREREGRDADHGVHLREGDYEFHYVLQLPKHAKVTISSINGDLLAESIQGELTAELINGDIDIKGYVGDMDLQTINGAIDLSIGDSQWLAETIHGQICADESLAFKVTDRIVGQRVEGGKKGNTHWLRLNTVNGNMYLRR